MTDRFEFEEADLERFFRAARTAAPAPSGDFLTRLATQAEAAQRKPVPPRPALPVRRRGLVSALAAALGGWAALGGFAGGMATATVAGLWIGLAGAPTLVQAVGLGSTVTAAAEADSYLADADVLALAVME
ncbi:hypothetical protein FBT96_18620 [Rhodobacter capsulatus]|uniref:Dihydroorotate dehydrogenase n=1 Tax=Rhodobacter capsulatus TaxID=1061 RepID=A0A4V5PNS4_RHOCA|nr:hypothetical protein [Rhodobacter capsulatus]TKD13863.1 hypothetical protein FBT96_18620 [Rhodobacter capsulatus]